MSDNKLTDNEIIKEIQDIRESMKRHIDLTNEMGQDLLRIDEEYTGGSKVWLTTDYFKKVVKHFCHSNYLVKCMELIFEYINRLQAENERLKEENENLRDSLVKKKFKDELFEMTLKEYTDGKIKEFAELVKKHSYFDHKDQRKVVAEIIYV